MQTQAIRALAESPRLAYLENLNLDSNRLTNRSVRALLASRKLPRYLRLELFDNDYDDNPLAGELADRFDFDLPPEYDDGSDRWR